VLVLSVTLPALAQRPQPGAPAHPHGRELSLPQYLPTQHAPRPSLPQPLFRSPEVSRHLNITPDQSARLDRLTTQLQEQFRERLQGLGRASAQDRPGQTQQLLRDFNSELTKRLGNILDQNQMQRFSQLELQSRGLSAFTDPAIQKQLGLTENQISRLTQAAQQTQQRLAELLAQEQNEPQAARRTFRELLRHNAELLERTLTPGQMQTYSGLSGQSYPVTPYMMAAGGYPGYSSGPGQGQHGHQDKGQGQQSAGGQYGQGGDSGKPGGESQSGQPASPAGGRIESRTQSGPFLEPFFRMDHVVRTLDLTPDQFNQLTALTAQLQNRHQPEFGKLEPLDEKERELRSRALLRTYSADWLKGAETILSRHQMDLYREFVQPSGIP
jgi:hypothetical protein